MCQLWSVLAALAHGEDSRAASWQFPELPYVQRFQLLGDDCGDPLGDLRILYNNIYIYIEYPRGVGAARGVGLVGQTFRIRHG